MSNILEELNKIKSQLTLTPEEKEKLCSMGLEGSNKVRYIHAVMELKAKIKALGDKIADNKERMADLQIINEELKKQQRNLKARLQTLKAKKIRGEYIERI